MNIIKSWNSKTIRIREDKYVNLTDMAQATGESVNIFLKSHRALSIITALYRCQSGTIAHPIIDDGSEVWVCIPLAKEFCYQSKNYDFSVWMDDVLWGDIFHPEVFPCLLNQIYFGKSDYSEIEVDKQSIYTFVYFILNVNDNTVKIGYSKNPEARISAFRSGSLDQLKLLKTMTGGKDEEASIHRQFAEYRITLRREIFRFEGKLKKFIDSLPDSEQKSTWQNI